MGRLREAEGGGGRRIRWGEAEGGGVDGWKRREAEGGEVDGGKRRDAELRGSGRGRKGLVGFGDWESGLVSIIASYLGRISSVAAIQFNAPLVLS